MSNRIPHDTPDYMNGEWPLHEHPLTPAKGILVGLALSALIWTFLISLVLWATQ